MTVYAQPDNVWESWRPSIPLTEAEKVLIATKIGEASRLLRSKVRALDDWIADGTLEADLVKDQVVAAVVRYMKNPDGYRSVTVDDVTRVRDNTLSAGALYFTPDELAVLAPAPTTGAVGTMRLGSVATGLSWSCR